MWVDYWDPGGRRGGDNTRTGTVAHGSIVVESLVGLDESGTCFSARKAPMSK